MVGVVFLQDGMALGRSPAVLPPTQIHIFNTSQKDEHDFQTAITAALDKDHYAKTGVSLLTGLRAFPHLGRPRFKTIFESVHRLHPKDKITVYSCAPSAMVESVEEAKSDVNATLGRDVLTHNFSVY
jgi:hypothetical protein